MYCTNSQKHLNEPKINSVEKEKNTRKNNGNQDCNVFSEIGELTVVYRNR